MLTLCLRRHAAEPSGGGSSRSVPPVCFCQTSLRARGLSRYRHAGAAVLAMGGSPRVAERSAICYDGDIVAHESEALWVIEVG